jgi:predicted DNA-binding transcriptional regulator YafY
MRASRLLTIMMLLQARGRLSAETLAEELEVSVRTVYRDVDQLSASGVPIYAETGRNGGFELLDGWRTRLTGLTAAEAQALFLSGLPGPAAQLGLGNAMATAELKLLAALPADWQHEATRISARFHLDPQGWFQPADQEEHLKTIAEAVWAEKRLAVRYESWKATADRVLEPLGLVLKGGTWYMVAMRDGMVRTYRLANIRALSVTGESFRRPDNFDLPRFWAEAMVRFAQDIYVGEAEVRASALGVARLKEMGPVVRLAIEAREWPADADGWTRLIIPTEDLAFSVRELSKIGPELEVLSPAELRAGVADIARRMAELYAQDIGDAAPRV